MSSDPEAEEEEEGTNGTGKEEGGHKQPHPARPGAKLQKFGGRSGEELAAPSRAVTERREGS